MIPLVIPLTVDTTGDIIGDIIDTRNTAGVGFEVIPLLRGDPCDFSFSRGVDKQPPFILKLPRFLSPIESLFRTHAHALSQSTLSMR